MRARHIEIFSLLETGGAQPFEKTGQTIFLVLLGRKVGRTDFVDVAGPRFGQGGTGGEAGKICLGGRNVSVGFGADGIGDVPAAAQTLQRRFIVEESLGHIVLDRDRRGIFTVEDVGRQLANGAADLHVVRAQIEQCA